MSGTNADPSNVGLITINVLPDDMLVEIFFYVNIRVWYIQNPWHALVHVCRRWRHIVFASPRSLDLRLEYRGHGPVSEVLDAWPVLPVMLRTSLNDLLHPLLDQRWDNRVAALESKHHNRICEIRLSSFPISRWERFTAAMQKPFPELTCLQVSMDGQLVPVLPDSFLGRSAPRLRELKLGRISFPSMPKLLLSANDLITLTLEDLPGSGYLPSNAMATALTVMTRLESLYLRFRSPRPRRGPPSRLLPRPTRIVLPALTKLTFQGAYEYLEDLLAPIDTPLLYRLYIVFFTDLTFDVPQLHRLIGYVAGFKVLDHADILILDGAIRLDLDRQTGEVDHRPAPLLGLQINCRELDRQLSSLAQVCGSSFPLISALEVLKIREAKNLPSSHWNDDVENAQWVELLDPFTAVKNLYLTGQIARHVCGALQELPEEMTTEVLPALRNLFVDGPGSLENTREAIRPFVAARQVSGHPVAIEHWRTE